MRVVVTGATGNVGTSLLPLLRTDPEISWTRAVARRIGDGDPDDVQRRAVDIGQDRLEPVLEGANAIVHLAWDIQPSHSPARLWSTNVKGTHRLLTAAAGAGVDTLVYASSVGVYSPGPKDVSVDENWPREGVAGAFYSRHKAVVEWMLDDFQRIHPGIRVVRIRPALIFKRQAAEGIRRLFIGPLVPRRLFRPHTIPFLPLPPSMRFQAVHTSDVAAAFHAALHKDVSGPFNLAAPPPLDPRSIASLLGTVHIPIPTSLLSAAVSASWAARLQPTPPGWVEMAAAAPVMETSRAERELGWSPTVTAIEALTELLTGLQEGADFPTPPLSRGYPRTSITGAPPAARRATAPPGTHR